MYLLPRDSDTTQLIFSLSPHFYLKQVRRLSVMVPMILAQALPRSALCMNNLLQHQGLSLIILMLLHLMDLIHLPFRIQRGIK